jgi:ABC-type polar amino acid transport system ATPase subunit
MMRHMTGELLRVDGLVKRFGDNTVLDGVSLTIRTNDVHVLIGPSGCGKSTLLRCMNLLELPSAGTIVFEGRETTADSTDVNRVRARMGMVFQHFNLFDHLTALDNVALGPVRVLGLSKDEAQSRARDYLKRVGLADKIDAYPQRLSGGQQQRVGIARALAMEPALLLFDEPTSSLDPELVGEVLAVIRDVVAEGRTMLLATHEIDFARHIATTVSFMDAAIIEEQGPPAEVLDHPKRPRTQQFLRSLKQRVFDEATNS